MSEIDAWIGRTEVRSERLAPQPLQRLGDLFDRDEDATEGAPLPPMSHWLYFLPTAPQSQLGGDGHPPRGGFMPPIDLPRRMFAGGRTGIDTPLRVGELVRREATIMSIQRKEGRTGTLVFVTVRYQYLGEGGTVAVTEEQDIVYTDAPGSGKVAAPGDPVPDWAWRRRVQPDPTSLFRFSALTYNAHRIHYDRPYATEVEGYPDLVVHGPFLALHLVNLWRDSTDEVAPMRHFRFKAKAALFLQDEVTLIGRPAGAGAELAAHASTGRLAMTAAVDAGSPLS